MPMRIRAWASTAGSNSPCILLPACSLLSACILLPACTFLSACILLCACFLLHAFGELLALCVVQVSTEVRAQPPELYNLLAEMDGLISALSLDHRLATDLGNGRRLLRHEMQVTCYPGGGACYVRHMHKQGHVHIPTHAHTYVIINTHTHSHAHTHTHAHTHNACMHTCVQVRHVDDALVNRARVLTCILYSNPGWQVSMWSLSCASRLVK